MNYKRNLMAGLIGLALVATPVIAAAQDHDKGQHESHSAQSHSDNHPAPSHSDRGPAHFNAPEHNNGQAMAPRHEQAMAPRHEQANMTRNEPAMAPRHEFREEHANRNFSAAPAVETRRDFRQDRRENRQEATAARRDFHEDRREARFGDRDRDDHGGWKHEHPDYDYDNDRRWGPYYTGGPNYLMPGGYAGGSCSWARHLRAVYVHDRYTGHYGAASDLLPRVHRAERACGLRYGSNGYYGRYGYYR